MNPYLERVRKAGLGRSGVKSEKATAKRLGAKQTRYSGAMPNERADMSLNQFKIEAKSTINSSFSIKLDVLAKVAQEAKQENLVPALSFAFVLGNGEPHPHGAWVCIPESVFKGLVG